MGGKGGILIAVYLKETCSKLGRDRIERMRRAESDFKVLQWWEKGKL